MNDQAAQDRQGLDLLGATGAPAPYRVIARKYRPLTFDQLIGQTAMVRTLRNAFASGRIPQAWMLTGVRGVGKTTTARILARALNYELPGNRAGGPTIDMPRLGVHCEAIIESRHVDVQEIDAASHTSIEDVKQIIDGIRYAPVAARMKVYIIDEVHMLSEKAFNAFLKTLEEPPPHAKFIFATTEVRKVPVTILSRCQRFDLRRVGAAELVESLRAICSLEKVEVANEALAVIARAAEGSVRDSQSLLDQAIAHGDGVVTAETVRAMIGLADRGRVIDLFESVMGGDLPAALATLRDVWSDGADPAVILSDLAEFTHLVTRLKIVPGTAGEASLTEVERARGIDFAGRLSMRVLSRAWSMLTKAVAETHASPRPLASAEMALVRLAHAADLPTPDEVIRSLRDGPSPPSGGGGSAAPSAFPPARAEAPVRATAGGGPARIEAQAAPSPTSAPRLVLRSIEDVIALADQRRDIQLKNALFNDVRLVGFEQGRIEFGLAEGASRALPTDLARKLQDWTGERWIVALSHETGAPTLRERETAAEQMRLTGVRGEHLVRAVLDRYPGAQIVAVRDNQQATSPPAGEDEDALDPDASLDHSDEDF